MFRLCSSIKIGGFSFTGGVSEVEIKKSIHYIMDIATISLPALSRIKNNNSDYPQTSVETAKLFKEGDPVTIQLGYNDELKQEFTGFVRRVNFGTPVTLNLEGYGWQLRGKNYIKTFRTTTLRQVLEFIIQGTDITLSSFIPDIPLEKFYINNQDGLQVLQYLQDKLLLTVFFNGSELYAGLQQGNLKPEVKYQLGFNVIKDDKLQIQDNTDKKVQVVVNAKDKGGKTITYKTGEPGGDVYNMNLPNIKSLETLKNIGDEALKERKNKSYSGTITGFLYPYCEPAYKATIQDPEYELRAGSYFVTSVEVFFGMRGARRKVSISHKLN